MQFHLSVVSVSLKTCVEDHGNAIALEKKIWLVCIEALLLYWSGFVKSLAYFNKQANNFETTQ